MNTRRWNHTFLFKFQIFLAAGSRALSSVGVVGDTSCWGSTSCRSWYWQVRPKEMSAEQWDLSAASYLLLSNKPNTWYAMWRPVAIQAETGSIVVIGWRNIHGWWACAFAHLYFMLLTLFKFEFRCNIELGLSLDTLTDPGNIAVDTVKMSSKNDTIKGKPHSFYSSKAIPWFCISGSICVDPWESYGQP